MGKMEEKRDAYGEKQIEIVNKWKRRYENYNFLQKSNKEKKKIAFKIKKIYKFICNFPFYWIRRDTNSKIEKYRDIYKHFHKKELTGEDEIIARMFVTAQNRNFWKILGFSNKWFKENFAHNDKQG